MRAYFLRLTNNSGKVIMKGIRGAHRLPGGAKQRKRGSTMEFILREWEEQDAEKIVRYADNPKIAANLRNSFPYPYTLSDARAYVDFCVRNEGKGQLCRAIEIAGEPVGSIGIFLQSDVACRCAELGYWLAEPFWGRGIMSGAARRLCKEAFERFDLLRICAEPFAYNTGSRRVLEKAGFELEGILKKSVFKNGQVYDSCMYALIK
jgi:ribosomal-protein-alanine N-acetyltransferase